MTPGTSIGFDDQGQRVLAVPPAVYDEPEDHEAEDAARLRQETLCRLLALLTSRATSAKKVGQRVYLLAHILHRSGCKTQKQLARRLKVTPGRISQALNSIRAEFALLSRE